LAGDTVGQEVIYNSLFISHGIFVKQHAGSVAVDTEPGKFTEFKIALSRGRVPCQIGGSLVSIPIAAVMKR
jgi:hypothetical protein